MDDVPLQTVEPALSSMAGGGPDAKNQERRGFIRLLILFLLSGTAALVYELVWFQLLRLTIGGSSQSLGVLLACFMGGLCLGSALYGRVVPRYWHPLRVYAVIELGIALCGLGLPVLLSRVSGIYFSHATTPTAAVGWRSLICLISLTPPTILMGATLPALARWLEADAQQTSRIGRLYAANVTGAVVGVFLAALVLLPRLGLPGTNSVAICLNVLAAIIAISIRTRFQPVSETDLRTQEPSCERTLTYLAYAVSGMAALSFEVLWARLMGSVFGATVYGFALVLGVFLLGLGAGGAVGSALVPRLASPRRTFGLLQLAVVASVGLTSWLVPLVANLLVISDLQNVGDPVALTGANLVRSAIVVFPAAFFWGMLFPVAVACLGGSLSDPARPVGRLYAWNTVGAVVGSLATSFLLIPHHGSAMGTSHLILLPLCAGMVIVWPRAFPAWAAVFAVIAAGYVTFFTEAPSRLCEAGRVIAGSFDTETGYLVLAALPAFLGFELFLVKRDPRRLVWGAAGSALIFAFSTAVPARLYQLGRAYGSNGVIGADDGEIVLFEEGTMEPVVVYHSQKGPLEVSINSMLCASTVPDAMEHLRLLGHLPALLARDPRDSLVIGLGAGVTAGCVALHDRVERLLVIELEPKVKLAAAEFAESNHDVMNNPKVQIRIDDGRHFIATTDRKFGVITSDPIEPFWAGSAALYTVEHYRRCR